MKHNTAIATMLLAALTITTTPAVAQNRAADQAPTQGAQQTDRARGYDRDRQQIRDRRDAPDRERQRQHTPDTAPVMDRDIYGHELMSQRERDQYRAAMRNAESAEQRELLRSRHQREMQSRATARGIDLTPTSEGPIYGGKLMSVEERNQYRERLRMIESDEERTQVIAEHREQMRARAKTRGIDLDDTEEAE